MSPAEYQELHHKTQLAYAGFAKGLKRGRLQDHHAMAKVAQSHTILTMLESAPKIGEYHPIQRSQFHSLPLHIASKARMEHKEAMARMNQPRWKKILEEFE